MKKLLLPLLLIASMATAQDRMTPELLWSLKRVSGIGVSENGNTAWYASRTYDMQTEKSTTRIYALDTRTGTRKELQEIHSVFQRDQEAWYATGDNVIYRSTDQGRNWKSWFTNAGDMHNIRVSPDGKWIAFTREVLVKPMMGTDLYPDLPKNTAQVYTDLNYRHWDSWEDGKFSHLFIMPAQGGKAIDLLEGEPYDVPQQPFGGPEDFVWSPDSRSIVYVCKKKFGKEYAASTNTDIYQYVLDTKQTINLTANMPGYDMSPAFSPDGRFLAWTSMAREGYEADKNDIYVMDIEGRSSVKQNLTANWDGTVSSYIWSKDGKRVFFNAAYRATEQVFEVNFPGYTRIAPVVRRITTGNWDVTGILGQVNNSLIVSRTDMNHAAELFKVDLNDGSMKQITHENDDIYNRIQPSRTELRMVQTTDKQMMGVWVIYPPGFDSTKKYPTLLYCQGGPQSALSQFYSFRWNFQLMAHQGYIVVAPNRRGMPGWGVKWNEAISQDWGGQPMRDYLAAIDEVAQEPYVDQTRLGCVGASYGGYSVFMLAGMHENRFRSFIAHDGLFDLRSWYGTTEELWFANWDIGGPYWKVPQPESYRKYDPANFVAKWNTPIMIIQGGIDFRVPIEQGLEAFQAAQLKGIKSKLLYFPNENHWILHPQNAIVWQREFFGWLQETLR